MVHNIEKAGMARGQGYVCVHVNMHNILLVILIMLKNVLHNDTGQ